MHAALELAQLSPSCEVCRVAVEFRFRHVAPTLSCCLTNRASAAGKPTRRAHNSCPTSSSTAQRLKPDGPAAAGAG